MSAKKRGPGRPPKNAKKNDKLEHSVPSGFWSQVGAVFLIVVALTVSIGLFNAGGIFPVLRSRIPGSE